MPEKLQSGDRAPELQTLDIWNSAIHIPSGQGWTYLSFHRFADCPFCNLRMHALLRNQERFKELGIEIVTVWPSSRERLLRHSNEADAPIAVVSDPAKKLYRSYAVSQTSLLGGLRLLLHPGLMWKALVHKKGRMRIDSDPRLLPASFLIDPEGVVRMAYYGKHYGDHPEMDDILQQVKE